MICIKYHTYTGPWCSTNKSKWIYPFYFIYLIQITSVSTNKAMINKNWLTLAHEIEFDQKLVQENNKTHGDTLMLTQNEKKSADDKEKPTIVC